MSFRLNSVTKMANITQFVRQQSQKNVFINAFSEDLEDRLEMRDFYGGGETADERKRKSLKRKTRHDVSLLSPTRTLL